MRRCCRPGSRAAIIRARGDPYFLYAASNVGSIIALLSYPFVVEPFSRLGHADPRLVDRVLWTDRADRRLRAAVLAINPSGMRAVDTAQAEARPSWRDAAIWMALAAIPAALLIAVTAHLSTDIAPSPFLWVIPLAFYLLTFVIVFQQTSDPAASSRGAGSADPARRLVATIVYTVNDYLPLVMLLHVVTFFVTALVCHGELARRRPPAGHLTSFYMWMSAGGVIGGICAALVAPHLFSWIAEYPDPDRARDPLPAGAARLAAAGRTC